MGIEAARLRRGEKVSAKHLFAYVKELQSWTIQGGRGVRVSQFPWGRTISQSAGEGGSFASTFFRPTIRRAGGGFELRFETGVIGGVKPTIDGEAIDKKSDGKFPALIVKAADFDADEKRTGIYFRCTVDADFAIVKVEPIASAKKPAKEPKLAHKLCGFLFASGAFDRHLYSDLGFYAANRTATGNFDALFFWAS